MPKLPPPAQKEITRGGWKYIWDDTKERYIPTEGILSERERRAPIGSWVTGISPTPPVNISEAREKLGSIRTGLTVGGSLAGGLFGGGVPGSFAGGLAGSTLGQIGEEALQKEPQYNPLAILPQAGAEAAVNEALGLGFKGVQAIGRKTVDPLFSKLKGTLLRRMFPTTTLPEDVLALQQYPELEPSVGQATGSSLANLLEGGFQSRAKLAKEQRQQGIVSGLVRELREDFTGNVPALSPVAQREFGAAAQDVIIANKKALEREVKSAYTIFDEIAEQNKIIVREVTGKEETYGFLKTPVVRKVTERKIAPVYVPNTLAVAGQEADEISKIFGKSNMESLPPFLATKYARAKAAIDDFLKPTEIVTGGKIQKIALRDVITARKAKSELGKLLFNKAETNWTPEERILGKLYKSLEQDIDMSVSTWTRGSEAQLALQKGAELTTRLKTVFNKDLMSKVWQTRVHGSKLGPNVDLTKTFLRSPAGEVFKSGYGSYEKATEILEALGPAEARIMKGGYFEHVFEKAVDTAKKEFYPDKIINEITDVNSAANAILNDTERRRLVTFARALRPISAKDPTTGQVALRIREAGLALTLSSGLVSSAVLGAVTTGVITGTTGLGIVLSAKQMSKALMNPESAKAAMRLPKIRPYTPESKAASKTLLWALRGTQVVLEIPDFGQVSAYINQQGKVDVIK